MAGETGFRAFIRDARAAFTLVELLVVIAILAILASLLMPALEQALDAARAAACAGNLRQTMLASFIYQNNYGEILPTWITSPRCAEPWGKSLSGQQLLYEADVLNRRQVRDVWQWYQLHEEDVSPSKPGAFKGVRGQSVLCCPSGQLAGQSVFKNHGNPFLSTPWKATGWKAWWDPQANSPGDPPWFQSSYSHTPNAAIMHDYMINANFCRHWDNGYGSHPTRHFYAPPRRVDTPASETLYMIEGVRNAYASLGYVSRFAPHAWEDDPDHCYFQFRHGPKTNYACYDGHVSGITRDELFTPFLYNHYTVAKDELPFVFE